MKLNYYHCGLQWFNLLDTLYQTSNKYSNKMSCSMVLHGSLLICPKRAKSCILSMSSYQAINYVFWRSIWSWIGFLEKIQRLFIFKIHMKTSVIRKRGRKQGVATRMGYYLILQRHLKTQFAPKLVQEDHARLQVCYL